MTPGTPAGPAGLYWLATCLLLCPLQPALAQQDVPVDLPSPVVLVLNLISKTHLKPTTGVVVHHDGLVVVPADFVSAGDEIVVLDGGTDIARNGRPAKTIRRSLSDGLAVLSVEGLVREPVIISSGIQTAGEQLHFAAFPPAEQISEGAQPLGLPVLLESSQVGENIILSAGASLPNVAGPLFDRCGQLAGFNLPIGTPALEGDVHPRTLLAGQLEGILSAMDLELVWLPCGPVKGADELQAQDQASDSNELNGEPRLTEPAQADPAIEEPENSSQAPGGETRGIAEDLPAPEPGLSNAGHTGAGDDSNEASTLKKFSLAILLLAAILFGLYVRNRRTRYSDNPAAMNSGLKEPDTQELRLMSAEAEPRSGFILQDRQDFKDAPPFPEGVNAMLMIDGPGRDGKIIRCYCAVNPHAFSVLVGNDVAADLKLTDHAIAPEHVRIEGRSGKQGYTISLCELGSGKHTSIKDVPCLGGEIWQLEPGDEITLGDLQFVLRLLGSPGDHP